jgi:hypothetical protein
MRAAALHSAALSDRTRIERFIELPHRARCACLLRSITQVRDLTDTWLESNSRAWPNGDSLGRVLPLSRFCEVVFAGTV